MGGDSAIKDSEQKLQNVERERIWGNWEALKTPKFPIQK